MSVRASWTKGNYVQISNFACPWNILSLGVRLDRGSISIRCYRKCILYLKKSGNIYPLLIKHKRKYLKSQAFSWTCVLKEICDTCLCCLEDFSAPAQDTAVELSYLVSTEAEKHRNTDREPASAFPVDTMSPDNSKLNHHAFSPGNLFCK